MRKKLIKAKNKMAKRPTKGILKTIITKKKV